MTLFINNPAVEQVLTVAECMDALEQAHAEMGSGRATNGEIYQRSAPGWSGTSIGVLSLSRPIVDHNGLATELVAKKIIELAQRGECDPIRLRDRAVQSLSM